MTEKEFLNAVFNSQEDVLRIFLDALAAISVDYCVVGGLAVNAYAEPVVSLDLGIVVAAKDIEAVSCQQTRDIRISSAGPKSIPCLGTR